MGDSLPFGQAAWWLCFSALFMARGADLFSTWVATPNLLLEANPLARRMGWRWGLPINLGLCLIFAFFPLPGIIIATTSAFVAARNFQQAWLMRSWGEEPYRAWHVERLLHAPVGLVVGCLVLQNVLVGSIGIILAWSAVAGSSILLVPFGIGLGIMTYAITVVFYTLLALWRIRRSPF